MFMERFKFNLTSTSFEALSLSCRDVDNCFIYIIYIIYIIYNIYNIYI